jgi:hypothetical protein
MNIVHKINLDIFDTSRYNQRNYLDLYLKEIKMLNTIFERFIKESPVSVISRSAMERIFNPEQLDQWFDSTAQEQYTKDLLFSSVFDIMSQVVCKNRPSVNAAYQASKDQIGVSITSLYNKINGIEPHTSAELVRYAAREISQIIEGLGGAKASPLPGFRVKLLDGNCIEKTHHRIKELRTLAAGPLPGKSLVVYDPCLCLPVDVFPCEDGHSQERSLLSDVLETVAPADAWVADRNFCTLEFTTSIALKGAFFVIREHKKYPWNSLEKEKHIGDIETGKVFEQPICVVDSSAKEHTFRRISVQLISETRDGDSEIAIITNVPEKKASATTIADVYRGRWTIETAFQYLADYLNSEINALGYPRAALFGFCVSLIAYMVLATVRGALASVHGADKIDEEVSGYYIADEISATFRGMMIALPENEWYYFRTLSVAEYVNFIQGLARQIKLTAYRKHKRGPKKAMPKRKHMKQSPHVSTARIIAKRKK